MSGASSSAHDARGARICRAARRGILAVALAIGSGACVPPGLQGDWRCLIRDSNGNPYTGFDPSQARAEESARWQCVSGSPYKFSCQKAEAECERL